MKNFCIGTLTHEATNRDKYLVDTINSFLENTIVPEGVNWFIYINGDYDSPVINSVREMIEKWGYLVNFYLFSDGKNLGVGAGINQLNGLLKIADYSLFLEGDWITLPEEISGIGKDWLIKSLDLMETEGIEQVQFRKYLNDTDDRQFGFGYWIAPYNIKNDIGDFVILNEREYTNNPHIRNNKKYFDLGIFPLDEFFDENGNPTELKTSTHWGQAEIYAEPKGKQLKSAWLKGGNMVHCEHWGYDTDWEKAKSEMTNCKFGLKRCKYGFTNSREIFCNVCDNEKDFTDLQEHNWKFERLLDKQHKENAS